MLRIVASLALIAASVSVGFADEPSIVAKMTLAERLAKANADFSDALKSAGRDRALQTMVVGKRNENLSRLAIAAEAAKTTEYEELTKIYFVLDKFTDCVRVAKLAVKARPTDYGSQQKLVLALGHLEKTDEAVAELKKMLAAEPAAADIPQYLSSTSFAVAAYVALLTNKKNYSTAEEVIALWGPKLDKLPIETEQMKGSIQRAKQTIASLQGRIEMSKRRDALLGQPYPPILEATWLNGSELKPEDLRGKVVLIDFWAVWCGPCIATFPHLREWQEKYADKGLVIIGATTRYGFGWNPEAQSIMQVPGIKPEEEDVATMEFVKFHKLKHRIAVMADRDLSSKYAVSGIPQAVLIDRQGIVRLIFVGSSPESAELLERGIRDALGLPEEKATAER